MRRWTTAVALVAALWGVTVGVVGAQTGLVAGGLTALPPVQLGAQLAKNGGFETLSGGLPANWSTPSGWTVDQQVAHSGSLSWRRSGAAAGSYQPLQLKKGIYNLSAWVKTQDVGTGLRLQFDLRPTINEWQVTEIPSGTRDWTRYDVKNVIIPQDLTVTIKLEFWNGTGTGTAWFDDVLVQEQRPHPLDVFLLYPNYRGMLFDDQPHTMKFDVTVTPPADDFGRYKVRGTLKDEGSGQVIGTRDYTASAHFVAEMDGSAMQTGRSYLATFGLVDQSNGATVYTYPAYRVSNAPGSARQSMNISFDEKNRILVKGKPRFILGAYDSGGGYSTADSHWENQLWSPTGARRMDGLKINFYLNYWFGETPADAIKALMTNLQKRGVMYLQTGNCFDKWAAGTNFFINNSDAYVRDIGAHPGSAGYYTIDECRSELIPGAFNQYVRLRSLDPDSMTFAALFGNPSIHLWRDAADVISSDPYPMFGAEPSGGYNHKQVADWTAETREAVKDARPFLTVLQFFKFTSQGRWPTRPEMRNHAYMAIVEGAKGLWWWSLGNGLGGLAAVCSDWCAERTAHMNDLKAVVGEIADLEPVLLADDAPGALTGNSNPTAIRTKVKVVNGKGYVFAYNYTNQAASTTFTWNTAPGSVTVNAENRTLSASGNSFSDSFGPYQAHVYVIGNGGSAGGGTGGSGGSGGTTPPPGGSLTVAFTNPTSGATVSGTTTVSLSVSGGSGYTYKVAVDGTTVFTGAGNSFSWNTTTVANGSHTLTGTVTDSSGNSGTATLPVTVSNTTTSPPPASGTLKVVMTSPKPNSTVSGTVAVNIWAEGASGTSNTFTLAVDGKVIATQACTCVHVWPSWDTTKVAGGLHTLTASVKDVNGNSGQASMVVTTSNGTTSPPPPTTPLAVAFTAPQNGATVSGTTTVTMTASGGSGSGYSYRLTLDGAPVASTSSYSWNTTTATNGSHTLGATVTDSAGATASTGVTVTVSNTTTSPPPASGTLKVVMTSPKPNSTVSGTVSVNIWVEGASGTSNTFTLAVDGKVIATQTCNCVHVWPGWTTAGYTNGTHTLTATAKDAAGKMGTSSMTVTVRN